MKTAFEELSSEEIASAIEQNGFDFFLSLVTPLQAEVYDDAHILRVITKLPFSLLNVILRTHFESEDIDNKVEVALAAFGSPRLPLTWWIGPATPTPQLGKVLLAHGLVHALDAPGMAINLRELQAVTPSSTQFTITPVNDLEGIEQWVQTFTTCYQFDEQVKQIWLKAHRYLGLECTTSCRYYVGWMGSVPVATSLLFLHNRIAGIYQVATLPGYRGQGIGTAMTSVPLYEALREGYRIGVLESSQMAFSLYRHLGFQQYCTLSAYVWSP